MFEIRSYDPVVDLTRLHRLLSVVEDYDQDGEDVSEDKLRQQLTWRNHDPQHDCWLAVNPSDQNALVGYSSVSGRAGTRCTLYVAVSPHWRRQGLGGLLLSRVVDRARSTGADSFIIYTNANNNASNAFLSRKGYKAIGDSWDLQTTISSSFARPEWPNGFTVQSYVDLNEPQILADILNRGYAHMWGHAQNEVPTTVDGIGELVPMYWKPENIFLTFAPDGDVAGLCLGIPGKTVAIVEGPGVALEYRHLDLQRPLVLTVAQHLKNLHSGELQLLSYGDTRPTVQIYQELGFHLTAHFIAYRGTIN